MSQPYVGEIRMFGGNFAPNGWLFCDGQQLPISENDVLFQLIGTTYGGDGQETFNLPNLQSRIPIHPGTGSSGITYQLGEMAGTEQETLTVQQIPNHRHALLASTAAGGPNPAGAVPATSPAVDRYRESTASAALAANAVTPVGGSQPHSNLQPYVCINFIISLYGIYPQQN
jgi:microcystin-dependent protein